jgi:hypothetical protein
VDRLPNERHDQKPSPRGIINVPEYRLVIADDHQLELWHELEFILPHKASADPITAGQLLDPAFGPCLAFLCL